MGKKRKRQKRQKQLAALEELTHRLYESDSDLAVQGAVLMEAISVYAMRNKVHQGLWKENSLEEGCHHIMHKTKRFTNNPKECIDDGIDALNYIVFQIRNIRSGRV